ncbi:MAG: hypothetical protein WC635_10665 [Bacteriovorax sp.]|jgi:hypothetical protein
MKSYTAIFMIALMSTQIGCGKLNDQRIRKTIFSGNTAGLEEPLASDLTAKEKIVAKNVCLSLSKRVQALKDIIAGTTTNRIAGNFVFETKDCKNKTTEKLNIQSEIVSKNDTNTPFEYNSADTKKNFTDVITNKSVALEEICDQIALDTDGTKKIKNNRALGNKLYFTKFSDDAGIATVQINTKIANNVGGYNQQDVQLITIFTELSQVTNPRDLGAEKERSLFIRCNNVEFTTHKETFVRSVFL